MPLRRVRLKIITVAAKYLQSLTTGVGLVLEEELALAFEVALGVDNSNVADVCRVHHACVRQCNCDTADVNEDEGDYLLDIHCRRFSLLTGYIVDVHGAAEVLFQK
jgi:hypothetical protein